MDAKEILARVKEVVRIDYEKALDEGAMSNNLQQFHRGKAEAYTKIGFLIESLEGSNWERRAEELWKKPLYPYIMAQALSEAHEEGYQLGIEEQRKP